MIVPRSAAAMRMLLSVLAISVVLVGTAQNLTALQLHDPDPSSGSGFGRAVALSGDHAFVGEPGDGISESGAVHIYQRNLGGANAWEYVQSLHPSQSFEHGFGASLAATDSVLVVTRPMNSTEIFGAPLCVKGATYFYRLGADGLWQLAHTSGGEGTNPYHCFTENIGMLAQADGHNIAVADRAGSTWVIQTIYEPLGVVFGVHGSPDPWSAITPMVCEFTAEAANALAIAGDTVVSDCGSSLALSHIDGTPVGSGTAWMTDTIPWDWATGVDTWGDAHEDWNPLAAAQGVMAIANPHDHDNGNESGSVYILPLTDGDPLYPILELYAPQPLADSHFGRSIAMRGRTLAVASQPPGQPPQVQLFERVGDGSQWIPGTVLLPSVFAGDEEFGRVMQIGGNGEMIIGAPSEYPTTTAFLYYDAGAEPDGVDDPIDGPLVSFIQQDEIVSVQWASPVPHVRCIVYDGTGRTYLDRSMNGSGVERIELDGLASGLFLLTLVADEGLVGRFRSIHR